MVCLDNRMPLDLRVPILLSRELSLQVLGVKVFDMSWRQLLEALVIVENGRPVRNATASAEAQQALLDANAAYLWMIVEIVLRRCLGA